MAKGPRSYTAGTEKALFRLARGTCYFPGCAKPVIEAVEGQPVVAVDTAHISGAKRGSARYVESMTDTERAAFDNLILLCVPHHKLVDRICPEDYSIETLLEWKRENEPDDGIAVLRDLTESTLEDLLIRVMKETRPYREVNLEISAGILIDRISILTIQFEYFSTFLTSNPAYKDNLLVLCVTIRNTGTVTVSLDDVSIHYSMVLPGTEETAGDLAYLGRNDFYLLNPQLPYRLVDGASVQWLMKFESLKQVGEGMARIRAGVDLSAIYASLRLGSGETLKSEQIPWSQTQLER